MGRDRGHRSRGGLDRREGMTLVEILVVLAIVGVSAGAVVLGLGAMDRDTGVQIEANRLADRLRLAADDVLVAGRPLSLAWTADGYAFQGPDEVTPDLTDALRDRHRLPDGIRLQGPEGPTVAIIDPDGAAPVMVFALRKGETAWTVRFDGLNAETGPAA